MTQSPALLPQGGRPHQDRPGDEGAGGASEFGQIAQEAGGVYRCGRRVDVSTYAVLVPRGETRKGWPVKVPESWAPHVGNDAQRDINKLTSSKKKESEQDGVVELEVSSGL